MAKKKTKAKVEYHDLDTLYRKYDQARLAATEAEQAKKEASLEIKEVLGETQEASTPEYTCTFKYDKDREVETFDEDRFAAKDPKGYKVFTTLRTKYTTTATVPGVRKLVIVRKEQE